MVEVLAGTEIPEIKVGGGVGWGWRKWEWVGLAQSYSINEHKKKKNWRLTEKIQNRKEKSKPISTNFQNGSRQTIQPGISFKLTFAKHLKMMVPKKSTYLSIHDVLSLTAPAKGQFKLFPLRTKLRHQK